MPVTIPSTAFAKLLGNDVPLLDVRAPIEFNKGAFPASCNLPLLNDKQREQVGTTYKDSGREAAIALGHQLIDSATKEERLNSWIQFLNHNPDAALYCFRGGQRSQITQQWLAESGHAVPRVEGGFKALRRFLLHTLDEVSSTSKFIVVGGKTGCNKTHLIHKLPGNVDLEGRANHRGSAFGRRVNPQPSQINFENSLAIDFLKLPRTSLNRIFIEDESHSIGSVHLPPALHSKMKLSPLAIIEAPMADRTGVIFKDYIHSNYLEFMNSYPDEGMALFAESLLASLNRIHRRLGGELYQQVNDLMTSALATQESTGDASGHLAWIEVLLLKYYDPMYDYQLGKKSDRIVFRGYAEEFMGWASHINKEHP